MFCVFNVGDFIVFVVGLDLFVYRIFDVFCIYFVDNLDIVDKVFYFLLLGFIVFLFVDLGYFYLFLSFVYFFFNLGYL